jgi:hypothetical protein
MVVTFKKTPKKVVTGATQVKARVVGNQTTEKSGVRYEEEAESQEPMARRGSINLCQIIPVILGILLMNWMSSFDPWFGKTCLKKKKKKTKS